MDRVQLTQFILERDAPDVSSAPRSSRLMEPERLELASSNVVERSPALFLGAPNRTGDGAGTDEQLFSGLLRLTV